MKGKTERNQDRDGGIRSEIKKFWVWREVREMSEDKADKIKMDETARQKKIEEHEKENKIELKYGLYD